MPSVLPLLRHPVTETVKLAEGHALCKQMKTIAQLANTWTDLAGKAKKNGTELFCTSATAAVGLNQIWQGNYWTGITMTTGAALNLFKMYRGNPAPFSQILDNARSSTQLIQMLEKANKISEQKIDSYLVSLKEGQSKIAQERAKIAQLAQGASREVSQKVAEANLALDEADSLFAEAEKQIEKSKEDIVSAELAFVQINNGLQGMIAAAEAPLTEETPGLFKEQAEMMCELCSGGTDALTKALASEAKSQRILNAARLKQNEAYNALKSATDAAQQNLKEIALLAENKRVIEQNQILLQQIDVERRQNERRRKEQAAILEDTKELCQDAVQQMTGFDKTSLFLGVTTATVVAPPAIGAGMFAAVGSALMGAPFIAAGIGAAAVAMPVAAGTGVAYAVKHRQDVSNMVYNFLFGQEEAKKAEDFVLVNPKDSSRVSFAFDKRSSGIFGTWIGNEGSHTMGDLKIDLGKGIVVTYRVDMNQRHPIKLEDLLDLQTKMISRLNDPVNPLSKQECLGILSALENGVIDRGSRHEVRVGLVKKSYTEIKYCPYLGDIKALAAA